ncbi:MAG: hypothetical protein AAF216_09095 [Pseudomonadota bacterium]
MEFGRRQSGTPSGWLQAAIFNAMLFLLPFLAANVVASVFAARDFPSTPRPAALEATREAIKSQFEIMAPASDERRAYWADLVDLQLRERNLAAARGVLLAAPQMLDERDRTAVEKAAPQTVPFGTEDEQLVGAALLFLSNDVRVRYENLRRPPVVPAFSLNDDSEANSDVPGTPASGTLIETASANSSGFSVLGTFADLVGLSREWIMEPPETADSTQLRLTGLGLIADSIETPTDVNLAEAASLLKAADRARRLDDDYRARMIRLLNGAVPESSLRPGLETALQQLQTTGEQSELVRAAFESTIVAEAVPPLLADVAQINEIVNAVGAVPTLSLLEHVRGQTDLRRMRLLAEAGGDRTVALEVLAGDGVLDAARTGIELSREDVLEIMGLAAAAMALFWMVMLGLARNMSGPVRTLRYE